jgi:hypothetical protein
MSGIRVIVTGSRDYTNRKFVFEKLDEINNETEIDTLVHGGATGIDSLADAWAYERGIDREAYPVDPIQWQQYGKAAGPMRNERMAQTGADLCVAFPGGAGTESMKKIARRYNISVKEITE